MVVGLVVSSVAAGGDQAGALKMLADRRELAILMDSRLECQTGRLAAIGPGETKSDCL
jgi:hypothetical protein